MSFSKRLSDSPSLADVSTYLSTKEFAFEVRVSVSMVVCLLPYMCREPPPLVCAGPRYSYHDIYIQDMPVNK